MLNIFRRNSPLFTSVVAMIIFYLPWMNRGFVNYEFAFQLGAKGLLDQNNTTAIDGFWAFCTNPLGYSYFLSLIYRVIGFHEWLWLAKIPSLVGAILILISGWFLLETKNETRRLNYFIWSGLVVLSPMIAAFSTAATADILPVGLLMISIVLIFNLSPTSWTSQLLVVISFSAGILVKFQVAYFGPLLIIGAILRARKEKVSPKIAARNSIIYGLLSITILVIYLTFVRNVYGVFVSNKWGQLSPDFFNVSRLVLTFGNYLTFLGLFCGLLSIPIFFQKTFNLWQVGIKIVPLGILGWYLSGVQRRGELNFGKGFIFEANYARILESFGFISGVAFCIICFKNFKSKSTASQALILGVFSYLFLLSASRPTQRYLTFVIPIVFLLLVSEFKVWNVRFRKIATALTLVGFTLVSLFGLSYLKSQGDAAERMAKWVESEDLILETSPAMIFLHAGQHFWGIETREIRYEVIAVSPELEKDITEKVLHRETMGVPGKVTRVYILREVVKTP